MSALKIWLRVLRFSWVRALQASCVACMVFAMRVPPHAPGAVDLSLALLGERELPDGSWQGFDLLADSSARPERFQLTLSPDRDVRVQLDARSPDGSTQQIFPEPGKEGVLARGQSYALPGPHAFYALEGSVELILRASPVRSSNVQWISVAQGARGNPISLPLSDGARFDAGTERLAAGGPLRFERALRDR